MAKKKSHPKTLRGNISGFTINGVEYKDTGMALEAIGKALSESLGQYSPGEEALGEEIQYTRDGMDELIQKPGVYKINTVDPTQPNGVIETETGYRPTNSVAFKFENPLTKNTYFLAFRKSKSLLTGDWEIESGLGTNRDLDRYCFATRSRIFSGHLEADVYFDLSDLVEAHQLNPDYTQWTDGEKTIVRLALDKYNQASYV